MTTAMASVLIVEDEMIVARDLQIRLTQMGYHASGIAGSGEEAIGLAQASRPDLILVDIHLNGSMDGVETTRRIKALRDTPVVYLTAHSDEETLKRAKETEPYGYLIKPFIAEEVRTTIEMALNKHALEIKRREREQKTVADKDIALKEIIGRIEDEKVQLANFFQSNVERSILPLLRRIETAAGSSADHNISLIQERLANIMSPFVSKMERLYGSLSPREIEVSMLIRDGFTTKEIAAVLNTSHETVRHQRKDIRRKLGIGRQKINLNSFLKTL